MLNDSSVDRTMQAIRTAAGGLRVGARLPSTREFVRTLDVGPVTVQKALAQLVADGTVLTRPGAGTFVAARTSGPVSADTGWQHVTLGSSVVDTSTLELMFRSEQRSDLLPLSSAFPDATLQPESRLAAAMARAARRPGVWGPAPPSGTPELRAWFARQAGADPDDVLITSGGQSSLSATVRSLAGPGEPMLFAVPTYPGALAIARSAGVVPIPVPTDADGVRPDLLARAFATTGARSVYLQPTFANPDSSVLAADRREAVLRAARVAGAFVIEDDYARWLGHGGPTPAPLLAADTDGRVITLTSLTKAVAPAMRIGAVIARGPVLRRIAAQRLVDDLYVTPVLQAAAVELVTGPGWAPHLRALAAGLHERAAVMSSELVQRLPQCRFSPPRGSMSIWLALPPGSHDGVVAEAAARLGVAVGPGSPYWIGQPETSHLRLCFAACPTDKIGEAVAALAVAVGNG